ncbi:MAG: helix-turn-helix transcriptional regulator [Cyclobacteriaceae bacterium]|nr:helix-turn-helix transcriptional regulator [Cyclobacteriaceae bacterium]
MFNFMTWHPDKTLSKYVKRICFYEGSFSEVSRYRQPVLPYVTPTLEFLYGDRFHTVHVADGKLNPVMEAGFLGPITRYQIDLDFVGDIKNMAVEFWPHSFTALFGIPMNELADQAVPTQDILGAASNELVYAIRQAQTNAQRKDQLEQFLCKQIEKSAAHNDLQLSQALHAMHQGEVRVEQVAKKLGISERYLEKKFQLVIGVTPKRYMQILRFNRAIVLLKKKCGMMDMVVELGYHDQSHMIHEFKQFAGYAPSHYKNNLEFESYFLGSQQLPPFFQ